MKEERRYPPNKPCPPLEKPDRDRYIGFDAGESTNLYSNTKILLEDCPDPEWYKYNNVKNPNDKDYVPAKDHNTLTLQDIVNLVPSGAKLSDIRLDVSFSRHIEYFTVCLYHQERNLEAEEKDFQNDMENYEKAHAKYKEEMKEYSQKLLDYKEWKKQKDIKELEEKLDKLKK